MSKFETNKTYDRDVYNDNKLHHAFKTPIGCAKAIWVHYRQVSQLAQPKKQSLQAQQVL